MGYFVTRGSDFGPAEKLLAEPDMPPPATRHLRKRAMTFLSSLILLLTTVSNCAFAQAPSADLQNVIANAFAATHDGWSVDEVILNDDLNSAFLEKCRGQLTDVAPVKLKPSKLACMPTDS